MIEIDSLIGKGVIYKLTSPSSKIYIGQSINFKERLKKYKNCTNNSIGKYLYNAIKKYGFSNFVVEVLVIIELDDDIKITKKELNTLEIYYIKKFNSFIDGYNLTAGGEGSFKRKVSKETREKLSLSNIGKNTIDKIKLICPVCNNEFCLIPYQVKQRLRNVEDISTITCSRNCGYNKRKSK